MKKKILLLIIMVCFIKSSLVTLADTDAINSIEGSIRENNILSIVEIRLKSGGIEEYQIYKSEEVEDEKQIEDMLKYLVQNEEVVDIIKIDGQPLEETEHKNYVKDLWKEDNEKKEDKYKSEDGLDIIEKDEEGNIIEIEKDEILQRVNVLINNKPLKSDVAPFIKDGRVMIPIRFVAENYGVDMGWKVINKDLKIIWMEKNQFYIYLKIGDIRAFKSDEIVYMDTAPLIMKDRTFVPLSFISDIFNYKADYNSKSNTASICTGEGVGG